MNIPLHPLVHCDISIENYIPSHFIRCHHLECSLTYWDTRHRTFWGLLYMQDIYPNPILKSYLSKPRVSTTNVHSNYQIVGNNTHSMTRSCLRFVQNFKTIGQLMNYEKTNVLESLCLRWNLEWCLSLAVRRRMHPWKQRIADRPVDLIQTTELDTVGIALLSNIA